MRSMEEGMEEAERSWASRLNCAESVLRGVCFAQDMPLSDQAKRMATPFGGGVGRTEELCGALTGGVLAIGACIGRTGPTEDRLRSYEAAGRLYRAFLGRFGSTCCKVLNKSDFGSQEHRRRCGAFVSEGTRLTLEILREKG
jgi:C_GCAxxG_C_C family probable redox protein